MRRMCIALLLTIVATSTWAAGAKEPTAAGGDQGELVVFAAASLTQAFTQIGKDFMELHPGSTVTFNFAGSQALAQQLKLGASADVFASANTKQMEVAVNNGSVAAGSQRIFAHNRLVAIVSLTPSAPVTTLAELARPGLKLVLAAPSVPVGAYSRLFLDKASKDPSYGAAYREGVNANIASLEENVKAVLNKVVVGEADAGIVYSSDLTGGSAAKVRKIDIPDALNTIADYPIAPVVGAHNRAGATEFIDYVLTPKGQRVLVEFGLVPVTGGQN